MPETQRLHIARQTTAPRWTDGGYDRDCHSALALALSVGNQIKAKAAYQDFLTLWKDADPDIPILRQAKAEYAKLQ